MKAALLIFGLFFTILSCTKENDSAFALQMKDALLKADSSMFSISFDEQLPVDEKPVCLRFFITSKERFSNYITLEAVPEVDDESITIHITDIKDNGKCPTSHLSHLSTPPDPDSKCSIQGMILINNLKRGTYNFNIQLIDQSISKGKLVLTDQMAKLNVDSGAKIDLLKDKVNIVPDSCIFGTFYYTSYYTGEKKGDYSAFINEMKLINCREITLNPGSYREFAVNDKGKINFNTTDQLNLVPFILKTENNFEEIIVLLNNFLVRHPGTYGFIFEDSYGRYYNIKTGS